MLIGVNLTLVFLIGIVELLTAEAVEHRGGAVAFLVFCTLFGLGILYAGWRLLRCKPRTQTFQSDRSQSSQSDRTQSSQRDQRDSLSAEKPASNPPQHPPLSEEEKLRRKKIEEQIKKIRWERRR